jgi:hypothetical protein
MTMLHLMIAAALLGLASLALCQWGNARHHRDRAIEAGQIARGAKRYAENLRERCYELERTTIEIVGPHHLGRTAVRLVSLAQWRLIEEFMRTEERVQQRPLGLEPPYLVVRPEQLSRAVMEARQQDIINMSWVDGPTADARLYGSYMHGIPVKVERG